MNHIAAPLTPLTDDVAGESVRVVPFEVPGLGNRTYIATIGRTAILVDPPRDVDSLLGFVNDCGWSVSHVLETHVHNDYVSGGRLAAQLTGADYVVPRDGGVTCAARHIGGGEEFVVDSGLAHAGTIRAVHTPGHTPHHLTYVMSCGGSDIVAFTGGGLLYTGVGRTDLFGSEHTESLAHAQWRSAQFLTSTTQPSTLILPTHGFGSFCSVGEATVGDRSIAGLQLTNPVFQEDENTFVHNLISNLGPYPDYFHHMGAINRNGTPAEAIAPPVVISLAEAAQLAAAGHWVLDLRHRHAFADGHLAGSLSFDAAGSYVTYVGWLIPWDADIHVIVPDEATLNTAIVELSRIGIDRVRTAAFWRDGTVDASDLQVIRHADGRRLRAAMAHDPELPVLDVRLDAESARARLAHQRAIPLHLLHGHLDEVQSWAHNREVWVYCGSGFRSAVAASLLTRAGIRAVHVDGSVVSS